MAYKIMKRGAVLTAAGCALIWVTTALAGLGTGYNWNNGSNCVFVNSDLSAGVLAWVMSGRTDSRSNSACSHNWPRNPGQVGSRLALYRNGIFCTQNTSWVSNTTTTFSVARSSSWSGRPCASGIYQTRAYARVQIAGGAWTPNVDGAPYINSTQETW